MIWDCFPFRNELDLLEARMMEFDSYGVDVTHVLLEAQQDFYGRPKPLFYAGHQARYAAWADRIQHIVVPELPIAEDPWVREHAQRDAAVHVVRTRANPGDVVLICDADEIPARKVMEFRGPGAAALMMTTCHSAVDWLYPQQMPGSVVCLAHLLAGWSLSEIRDGRPGYHQIPDGGWHLSWLGGVSAQTEKLGVSCHRELPETERRAITLGAGYHHGSHHDVQMQAAEVDDTWPAYIRERRCPASWFRPRTFHVKPA